MARVADQAVGEYVTRPVESDAGTVAVMPRANLSGLVHRGEELLAEGARFMRRVSMAALIVGIAIASAAIGATVLFGVLVGWIVSH